MAHRIKPIQKANSDHGIKLTCLVLSYLGVIDSTYLLIYKLTSNNSMCLGNGGCHDVNFSPYSQIAGIPVSLLGLAVYLAMVGILLLENRYKTILENSTLMIFGISLAGVGFSAYLTWIELYVIHKVCPFCVASAVIIMMIFALAIFRLIQQTAS